MAQFTGTECLFQRSDVRIYVEEEDRGVGTLEVREDILEWSGEDQIVSLNYPDIGVHAVSRDSSVFPYRPCLLLLHSVLSMDADEDQEDVIQYRFALANEEHLDELFSVISECQRLYPDSDLSSNEEEEGEGQEEGNFYTSPEGLQELSAEGESVLRHLENILHINDDENPQENGCEGSNQFDDAESA